ncbi:unnamed protein product [Gulo gulo]|uniref:Uncharacterized protein n=1 Tax=Gulo gulo TaxID=48420 RepID=A0A9X9LK70_GULGU|nr:unnamed protein product [Gulo gulo]
MEETPRGLCGQKRHQDQELYTMLSVYLQDGDRVGRGSAGEHRPPPTCLPAAMVTPGPGSDVGVDSQPPDPTLDLTLLPGGSWRPLDGPQPHPATGGGQQEPAAAGGVVAPGILLA